MQNFTPLSFSAAEKSVTVQRNKQNDKQKKHSKLSIPHTTVWWDKNYTHTHTHTKKHRSILIQNTLPSNLKQLRLKIIWDKMKLTVITYLGTFQIIHINCRL